MIRTGLRQLDNLIKEKIGQEGFIIPSFILLLGKPKSSKSTFAKQFVIFNIHENNYNRPHLIISTREDEWLLRFNEAKYKNFVLMEEKNFNNIQAGLDLVNKGNKYDIIIIDEISQYFSINQLCKTLANIKEENKDKLFIFLLDISKDLNELATGILKELFDLVIEMSNISSNNQEKILKFKIL